MGYGIGSTELLPRSLMDPDKGRQRSFCRSGEDRKIRVAYGQQEVLLDGRIDDITWETLYLQPGNSNDYYESPVYAITIDGCPEILTAQDDGDGIPDAVKLGRRDRMRSPELAAWLRSVGLLSIA